ncbi:MAG: hypothetical protein KDA20_12105 [Phycisphaerales bacterium]|nr:hypothetical protein [Phycisphaerales bacterium]
MALRARQSALFRFDAGWLFLLAGTTVLCATAIIPAQRDLRAAQVERDKARAIEQWQSNRLEKYAAYLDAAQAPDERMARWLVATQLNRVPATSVPIATFNDPARTDAGATAIVDLEPPLTFAPPETHRISTLERLATGKSRLWLVVAAAVCVLFGLLPPARRAR